MDFFQNTSKSDFSAFHFQLAFSFFNAFFLPMFRKSQSNSHEIEVFQFALKNWFLVNKNKVLKVWSLPLHPLQNWKPSVTAILLGLQFRFPPFSLHFWPKHWKCLTFAKLYSNTKDYGWVLWKLFRAPGDEKYSSTFSFVCTSCNRVGGLHISVPHIWDTQGMFSRQFLKLVVAFMVWEPFFKKNQLSCIMIQVSELDKMQICSVLNSFKDPIHISEKRSWSSRNILCISSFKFHLAEVADHISMHF